MVEKAQASKAHHHIFRITGSNHQIITNRSAGLHNIGYAGAARAL